MNPEVSIILPVYNEEHLVARAIGEIQKQTFEDFEIILVDDGSCDETLDVVRRISEPRLKVLTAGHAGVAAALNYGIRQSRGQFIARHDADDRCAETRIEKQVTFLRNHPSVGVVGTFATIEYESSGRVTTFKPPESDAEIKKLLSWRNPIVHSSVMMRKSVITAVGLYRECLWEDYDLWLRLREQTVFANIAECLVQRTIRKAGCFRVKRSVAELDCWKIRRRALSEGSFSPSLLASVYLSLVKLTLLRAIGQ